MSGFGDIAKRALFGRKDFLSRAIILCVIGGSVWWLCGYVGNKILVPMAVRKVKQSFGGRVKIASVDFRSRTGAVRLNYLELGPEQIEGYDNRVLRAHRVDVRFSFLSVLMFRPKIKSIRMKDYIINAQYNCDTQQWNFGKLNIATKKGVVVLPKLKGRNGLLKVTRVSGGPDKEILESAVETILITNEFDWELKPVRWNRRDGKYAFYVQNRNNSSCGFLRGIWDSSKGQIALGGNVRMRETQIFGNSWEMENIQLEATYDDGGISISQLSWEMGDSKIEINCTTQWPGQAAVYSGRLQIKNLFIANEYAANKLVYSPAILDVVGPKLKAFFTMYNPNGLGDVDFEFSGHFGGQFLCNGTVDCSDIAVNYRKFPYSLEHIQGRLLVTQDSVRFENLKCSHKQVDLNIDGFSSGLGDKMEYNVWITSDNMQFDSGLYKALSRKQKNLWFSFTPNGSGRIVHEFSKKPGQEKTANLMVDLDGASAVYEHFPYQLKNLTGRLIASPGMTEFDNVVSAYDGKRITFNGTIIETENERLQYNIDINAENIPIDSYLKIALPTRQGEFYDQFTDNAIADVEIKVSPNKIGERLVDYIATVEIRGESLVYNQQCTIGYRTTHIPCQLNDVYVRADLTPDVVILREMTGTSGDGKVRIRGNIWPGDSKEDKPKACLSIEATEIELKDNLLPLLPENASDVFAQLQSSGRGNITVNWNAGAVGAECPEYKIVIDCPNGRLEAGRESWDFIE